MCKSFPSKLDVQTKKYNPSRRYITQTEYDDHDEQMQNHLTNARNIAFSNPKIKLNKNIVLILFLKYIL